MIYTQQTTPQGPNHVVDKRKKRVLFKLQSSVISANSQVRQEVVSTSHIETRLRVSDRGHDNGRAQDA